MNSYTALIMYVLIFASCSETNNKPTKSIEKNISELPAFLLYGELPPPDCAGENDSLKTRQYGFVIICVAGCDVTDSLIDSVDCK